MSVDRDAASVKYRSRITDVIGEYTKINASGMACCPFHDDSTPSLKVENDGDRGGWFYCFGCQAKGDVFDFLKLYHNVTFIQALEMLGGERTVPIDDLPRRARSKSEKSKWVARIWEESIPLQPWHTATKYLENRGLPLDELCDLEDLRGTHLEYRKDGSEHPVLVAALRDGSGALTGVQRTFLSEEGYKLDVDSPKMSLGQLRGSAIKLGNSVDEIIICEGLEDGLSLKLAEPEKTVWVAAGGNMMSSLPIPDECGRLVIAQDNDRAGREAARAAARSFRRPGREILTMTPATGFKDFNDELIASSVI